MNSSLRAQAGTRKFARVMGPFLVIVTATAIVRTSDMRMLLTEFRASSVWPWVTGAFVLLCGLVVVALHQCWRGMSAIIVSLLGWLTSLKGFFLLAFPETYLSFAGTAVGAIAWWRTSFMVMVLIGLYLTFVGWVPAAIETPEQPAISPPDAHRAAA